MRNIFITIIGLIVLVIVIMLGLMVSKIGGISIRSSLRHGNTLTISFSEPILPGVPALINWQDLSALDNQRSVNIVLRGEAGEYILSNAKLSEGQAIIIIPCDYDSSITSLVIRDSLNAEVLARQTISLMPPGRDCALKYSN